MNMADILRPFGTLAVAASLAFSPVSASAQQDLYQYSSITSSSMQVSETIKVLDMGLPSYGDISAPKSSRNAIKGVEAEREKEKEKEKEGATSTSVLPTKKAGSTLFPTKEKKTTVKKTEKKQAAASATATSAPLEIKKEDKKEENLKFVDMAMPSYSENASAPKKSKFAF